jgi:CheY-like chemotaxis protein
MQLNGRRILVVEDEALLALDIAATLEEAGAEVVGPAGSLKAALALAGGELLSGAVVDMRLGNEEARAVADTLGRRGVPFAFHTGHGDGLGLSKRWPAAPILIKPVSPRVLVETLAHLLAISKT